MDKLLQFIVDDLAVADAFGTGGTDDRFYCFHRPLRGLALSGLNRSTTARFMPGTTTIVIHVLTPYFSCSRQEKRPIKVRANNE